ncbi:MAG: carboxypeptidase-like regulatory domain-containing protein [Bacteroidota bacterium]
MGLSYFPKTGKAQNQTEFCGIPYGHQLTGACIVIAVLFLLLATAASAQVTLLEKNITIPKQNTTLYQALNLISQHADCLFIYDSETLESDRRVKLHADRQPLGKVLDNILANPRLAYKVVGKHILIYKTKRDTIPPGRMQQEIPGTEITRFITVSGHIFDRENKAAIPYATVGIVEENLGTITNSDGFFSLRIPAALAGTSLVVSHLGYMSQQIPLQLLDDQPADLWLDRRIISIQEVIIRYIDPEVILDKAMELRRVNNAVNPVYLTTFYREGVQKNNRCTSYSEAVFRVYKSPYDVSESCDQVKLLKSRKIHSSDPNDTVFLKLMAGVQSALQLDIVKCVPGFLDRTPPVGYTWKYSDLVSFNAKDAYAITFVQNAGVKEALYKGTLYVEKEHFAILGAEFEINPDYLDVAADALVLKKSHRLNVKFKKITYSVGYMPFNGRYYLSHARCDIQVSTRLRNHLSSDHFSTFLELATCHIDTAAVVKFTKQEILKPGVVFSDQPYLRNDDFWGDYNTITPETKLSEALLRIIGKTEEIR